MQQGKKDFLGRDDATNVFKAGYIAVSLACSCAAGSLHHANANSDTTVYCHRHAVATNAPAHERDHCNAAAGHPHAPARTPNDSSSDVTA